MSKGLAKAAQIIGVVVAIAAAIPTGGGSVLLGSALGVSTVAATAIAAGVGLAAGAIGAIAAAKTSLPATTISGNQSQFTASLDQGMPWLIGRTRSAGCAVHDITYDAVGTTANDFQTFYGVWSADRCNALLDTQIDNVSVTFASGSGTAQGFYQDSMWQRSQLGLSPEVSALTAINDLLYPPGWGTSAKLSGMAAFAWTQRFDHQGIKYPGGTVPQKRDILEGALAWDPRLDSTYPGGSGPQRATDESTWVYTENPFLLGLKWARGIFSNGKKKLGIGMALMAINVDSAVQAANVADANGWKVGGVVYSTDPKWDVLKKICAAGSGEPIRVGGMLHFLVDAPRVSLDTIVTGDIIGKCTAPSGARMRDRINGVIPTFRSPDNDWQLVPAAKISVPDYVTFDRRARTKAITWELVQSATQVAQLATYAIVNSREIDGIILPLKLRWIGYKPGDAVTIASSVVAMDSQLVVLRKRNLEPSSGAVTFTARTETTGKHAFALGKTTTPPPTPALATVDRTGLLNPGVDASWTSVRNDDPVSRPIPQDGATVGAPSGTRVAGVLADSVISSINAAQASITSLQTAITTLQGQVSGGISADISALQGQVSQAKSDLLAEVARAQASEGQVNSGLLSEVARALSAEGSLSTRVTLAQSAADGAGAAVTVEQVVRATNDSALGARIDTVKVTADGNTASLTSESAARASADSALGVRIDSVNASAGGSNAAISNEASARAAADGALGTRIDSVTATANSNTAAINTETIARSNADGALGARIDSVVATAGGNTAAISSEVAARASAEAAISGRIDSVSATANGNTGSIQNEALARANADGALSSRIDSINASSGGSSAAIQSEAATRASQDAALGVRIDTVTSTSSSALNPNSYFSLWPDGAAYPSGWGPWNLDGRQSRVAGVDGRPYGLQQIRASASEQTGIVIGGLRKTRGWWVIEMDARIKGSFSGVGAGFYCASEGLALQCQVDPDVNEVVRWAAENDYWSYRWRKLVRSTTEDYGAVLYGFAAYAGLGDVSAERIIIWDHLAVRPATDAEIKGQRADVNATSALAQVSSEVATRTSQTAALAQTQNSLVAQLNAQQDSGLYATLRGSINDTASAAASATGAVASRTSSLEATAGSLSASISQQSGAIASLQGRTGVFWQVTGVAGNGRAQISLFADANGGGGVDIVGNLTVSGDVLVAGTVRTWAIEAYGVTRQYGSVLGSRLTGTDGSYEFQYCCDIYFDLAYDADVLLIATGAQAYYGYPSQFEFHIACDGGQYSGVAGGAGEPVSGLAASVPLRLPAGNGHRASIIWKCDGSGVQLAEAGLAVFRSYR